MGTANKINKQVSVGAFVGLCLAMSLGLMALQSQQGIAVLGSKPDPSATLYNVPAKVQGGRDARYTQLALTKGTRVHLGEGATITFATDANGVGRIPLSMELSGADGASTSFSIVHALRPDQLKWGGSEAVVSGLRPRATYKVAASLWLWGPRCRCASACRKWGRPATRLC